MNNKKMLSQLMRVIWVPKMRLWLKPGHAEETSCSPTPSNWIWGGGNK